MRHFGFSSGALAKGDFRRGIALQRTCPNATAIELSALRDSELHPLVGALPSLDLSRFAYVSFHAPSRLRQITERDLVDALWQLPPTMPIVAHPELIQTVASWRDFGGRLCIENMDIRKPAGRTVSEMALVFDVLPEAGFCFDLGHARQIDPTMAVAIHMLRRFGNRIRQLHISEVGPSGEHLPLSILAKDAFRRVVKLVPQDVPVILEAMVTAEQMCSELEATLALFEGPVAQH